MRMELTTDDRLAIQDLCARACHTLDFDAPDGFAGLFVPGGVFQRRTASVPGASSPFAIRAMSS